jgi:type IV pilus assembly protein PilV
MTTHRRTPRSQRGVTLLEALVSLTILLIGIVGMMQMQIVGITADAGARSHTQAYQLARELAAALERLGVGDPLLAAHAVGTAPPEGFGHLLQPDGTVPTTGLEEWDDAAPLTGVTTDAELLARHGADPTDASLPRFQRRWSVWQSQTAATQGAVKLIAVSVTYREKSLPGLREAVLLTQVSNPGLSSTFAGAFR